MTEDILAMIVDDAHIRISPPQDSDTPEVVDIKLFMLACLYRRGMDGGFDNNMKEWFGGLSEDEFRKHVKLTTARRH